jgi:putative sigma-54 modulation protein
MRKIIKTKDLNLTDAIEDYIEKKLASLEKFTSDFNQESIITEIEIGRTTRHHQAGDIFRAEINLSINGKLFRVESERDDLYAAIDEVRDDLEQEIRKFKTKKETVYIRGARSLKKQFRLSPLARFRTKK